VLAAALAASALARQERSTLDGVYTNEQADRGRALYDKHCARCHKESMSGEEMAPALVGFSFAANWEGAPLSELLERMRTSMPEDDPGILSRQQNADILAHMLRVGQFPVGSASLPSDRTQLETILYKSANTTP
jgi:mono/diheme cytochrome c family protein